MNRASLSVCATRRTRPSSLSAPCPALGPGRVSLAAFPLADPLPSTTSAAPPWALFGSFTGTTRPSDFSRPSITGLPPWPSPCDPPRHHQHGRVTVRPPGSQHEEIARLLGFSDPAGSTDGSRKRRQRCCLPLYPTTSAPRTRLFRGSIASLRAPLSNEDRGCGRGRTPPRRSRPGPPTGCRIGRRRFRRSKGSSTGCLVPRPATGNR